MITLLLAAAVLLAGRTARRGYRIHKAHRHYDRWITELDAREHQAAQDYLIVEAIWALAPAERNAP